MELTLVDLKKKLQVINENVKLRMLQYYVYKNKLTGIPIGCEKWHIEQFG